ncbi:hypothetical protein BCR24_10640 [Enterococcus ureilyticus]|uniref:DUF5057 domain-containing protein n=1 Tax=Enterococcus ureilyticus TaxID=1131292 RepID=A0A1E5HFP8_9ENTE|nr:hypothetical protein [Enterococcus ureilyticus]MBM7689383.1 hypothetical protein [Enterococcus ureilyticus]OEG23761.1 hypothetical protein BCR24_10640 [Enterococcus ureilyticus]
MKIRGRKKKIKKNSKWLLLLIIALIVGGYFFLNDKLKASTVVNNGDFRLTAENKWSYKDKKNYASLEWDKVTGLNQSGYRLYQSEDGTTWSNRSLNYGKSIKVLNIYPEQPKSDTLKDWMSSLNLEATDGSDLIQVTSTKISDYNANPNAYLKNSSGEYQYDVLMFGSWDNNNRQDLNTNSKNETQAYIDSGRGVLFGHDTTNHPMFASFNKLLGLTNINPAGAPADIRTGGSEIKVTNDGYLMKYPFELANGQNLTIPPAHNNLLASKSIGTNWIMFREPYTVFNTTLWEDSNWTMGWYLKTNNNVGLIQTGHSNGASTMDERKIIANTLYNLAQVSSENFANDQTVRDDKAPNIPKVSIRSGKNNNSLSIKADSLDNGKEYQWYVEANTKNSGVKKSDVVKEVIISNIAGYFYEINNLQTSNLAKQVETYKDSYGRIDPDKFDHYVAPDDDSLNYETRSTFTITENNNSGKYLHVLAVDRSNNISQVSSQKIKDIPQDIDFKVERTKNETRLIELNIDSSLDNLIEEVEIRIPKNTEIKDFTSLILPTNWIALENSETADYKSFSFMTKGKNDLITLTKFINDLRFSINTPVNQKGEIQIMLHEIPQSTTQVNEVTKVSWTAEVPQKISLKAYSETGEPLPAGDLLLDQQITISKKESITPKSVEFYDFIKLVGIGGNQISPLQWIVTDEFQEGRLIYRSRKLTIHSRQVVTNPNDQVVLPKKGFGVLGSQTALGQMKEEFPLTMSSSIDNEANFDTYIIRYQISQPIYTFVPKVPMNYGLLGYVLTTKEAPHLPSNSTKIPVKIDASANPEFWLTTYIEPVTEKPTFYHWEYKENKLGAIKVE